MRSMSIVSMIKSDALVHHAAAALPQKALNACPPRSPSRRSTMVHHKKRPTRTFVASCLSILAVGFLVIGCMGGDDIDAETDDSVPPNDVEAVASSEDALTNSCTTPTNCSNCVYYARCRKPTLPTGITSYSQKKAIINSYTPSAGAVAIINTGDAYGHVAYVESVSGSTIKISEGNWPYGSCGERSNTATALKIVGYYK